MLSISIVTYKSDVALLNTLLESLEAAVAKLPEAITVEFIDILENSVQAVFLDEVQEKFRCRLPNLSVIATGKNLGYGAAHNLAIGKSRSTYHLILNPDVILDPDALVNGIACLESAEEVVGVSPSARDEKGAIQYLTKKYPKILDLFIRACGLSFIKKTFDKRLGAYENRELVDAGQPAEVGIISGCFMLCKTAELQKAGGFDENYFLYFEDFSLSMELGKFGKLMYCPDVKIIHYGGNASGKGLKHISHFVRSGWRFYNRYGWKFI